MKNYKKQIYLFLYVSLFIVISSFAVLFFNFRKQVKLQNELSKIETNLIQADSLGANLLQIETDKRGFQLTRDINYLKNYNALRQNSNANVAKLKKNIIAGADTKIIIQIDSLLQLRLANLDSGIVVLTTIGFDASIAYMEIRGKKDIRVLLNQNLNLLKEDLLQRSNENTLRINRRSQQNQTGLLILLSIGVALMLVATRTVRRAQQKIIKSHIKFKEAQRIAKIGSWEWDIATNKMTWSQEQFRLFGVAREKIAVTFEDYLDHLTEKEQENTKSLIKDALEGKSNYAVEHEIIGKDGTRLMVFEQGTVLFDKDNRPTGMFGTTQDITDRKKIEGELQLVQKKFQQIFDNTADGIYQSTVDGKFIMANPAMAKMFGYKSPDELIASIKDIGAQIYSDPAYRQSMAEILALKDHVENFEASLVTKNGDIVWVSESTRAVRNERGAIIYFEGTLKNITEHKKAEDELAIAQKKFQAIFDNSAEGIYQSTLDGRFIIANPSMARIFGYESPEELICSITDIGKQAYADPDERNKMAAIILAEGHVENHEMQVVTKKKEVIWVSANIRIVKDEHRSISYFEGTLVDITERKKAEAEILQLNRNLDQFANITAHDLQEPIRMVSGFLGLLYKKYNDILDEQGRSYIYRAKDGADRMSILIKDLLEFSRSGNKEAKKESVDLSLVMELVDKDLSIVMAETYASVHILSPLPIVTGTQSALYRLFLNLISNGIKFRKKDTSPNINITVKELPESWEFSVQDNGIGVAEKDQPKLFHAFRRLHRKEEYPGTGLGLVTCKKIVESHGGKIWMVSEPGKGTAFHFTIDKAA